MKKYLIGLIGFLVILTCAFTLKSVQPSSSKKLPSLYWFVGTTYTGRLKTHAQEKPLSQCPDMGPVHCEDGYDDNDFNITGDPTSGIKLGATVDDFILKLQ